MIMNDGAVMNPKFKKILSLVVIILSLSVVVILAFSNRELGDAWDAIRRMNIGWLVCIFLCWLLYTFFEAVGTWSYLRSQRYPLSILRVTGTVLIGFYYSNITPSAAGGQPMQVNSLRKAGIPVAYGTTAITIRFVCNQLVVCLMALGMLAFNREFVFSQLGGAIWAVRIGWLINFAAVPLVLLAAFQRKLIQKLAEKIIAFSHRIRLIHDPEHVLHSVSETLDTYQTALSELLRAPGQILLQLFFSAVSLIGLTATVVFTYYAFGLHGVPWYRIWTLSLLLFVSASYTPLPGASGAQEGGFLLYFNGIFTDGTIGLGLLVWRFFTYYIFLIVGAFTVLNEKVLLRRKEKASAGQADQNHVK